MKTVRETPCMLENTAIQNQLTPVPPFTISRTRLGRSVAQFQVSWFRY